MCTSNTIFAFYGYVDLLPFLFFLYFVTHLYCLVGCLSMIVWTHAVLGVLLHVFCIFVLVLVQRNPACF